MTTSRLAACFTAEKSKGPLSPKGFCNIMRKPTVSVILPVFNGEQYLRFAIESVLAQTFQDFELIIIDDGSADSTPAIAQGFGERVRYVRQDNAGVAAAFNHGLRIASGQYISWLSHDDVFLPAKLEKQVAALQRLATPAACYTDVELINADGEVIAERKVPEYERGDVLRHVLTAGQIGLASYSICYDYRCIEQVGFYSLEWRYTQDAEMLLRLARSFPLVRVPEVLMRVREHDNRGIRSQAWQQEVVQFYREHLERAPFEELFPNAARDASPAERSQGFRWIADQFASLSFPLYQVAYSQYRRALRENPADVLRVLRRIAGLYYRQRGGNSGGL
jgi:glycosyltransferase involved in cell wall biosynthesis